MARRKNTDYTPNAASRKILDRAWEHIESVDYAVSSRWLFYRLLQDGIYQAKSDYNKYLALMSRARRALYGPWNRDTLVDDTRNTYPHPGGHASTSAWADNVKRNGVNCTIDHWTRQDNYVEIWFEAAAMASQFRHYTQDIPITLRPFQGMPSIDYKNTAAMELAGAVETYAVPVVVLYFGDCDKAGRTIPETSVNDIRNWCPYEFKYLRVGLNQGDGERYGIPEDFEHPGNYQWEALDDSTAGGIIRNALDQYVDFDVVKETEAEETKAMAALKKYLRGFKYTA